MLTKNIDNINVRYNNLGIVKFYNNVLKKPLHFISSVLSWTIFIVLLLSAVFLLYYFISAQIYASRGAGYEPQYSLYTIISPSMVPNIEVYDVVIVNKVDNPSDIQVGDIISFNSSDFKVGETISVTHRVVEVVVDGQGNYSYYTKGDNNFVRDPNPVKYETITGKVSLKIPQLGRVQFFLASSTGWLLVVVIPSLFIIIKAIIKALKLTDLGKNITPDNKLHLLFKERKLLTYNNKYSDIEINNDNTKPQQEVDIVNQQPLYNKNERSLEDIYNDLKNITK